MTRRELIERLRAAAEPVYGGREAAAIAWLVAEKLYGLSRADIALEPNKEVGLKSGNRVCCNPQAEAGGDETFNFQLSTFNSLLAGIAAARPVQYLLGVADFYGLELEVGDGVLVPRPETEELVRLIIRNYELGIRNRLRGNAGLRILDVGTGSGAIAIALAKNIPGARVTAIDISGAAIGYAQKNNENYRAGVTILEADILEPGLDLKTGPYDIIVSNPPYIPAAERAAMADNVVRWEPGEALFVPDDDPLVFYRAIARFARRYLYSWGALYFEIHEAMGGAVREMLVVEGFTEIEIYEDINSKPRIVKCRV